MVFVCVFFLLPCLRAPGRGVPEFLAGPALVFAVFCSFMILILLLESCTGMSHMFHLHNGHRPNSRIMYRFSLPIYRWWTNRTRLHEPIGLRAKKIGRVPTSSNLGDGPSRMSFDHPLLKNCKRIRPVFPTHLFNGGSALGVGKQPAEAGTTSNSKQAKQKMPLR